jgi:hypothetical protein
VGKDFCYILQKIIFQSDHPCFCVSPKAVAFKHCLRRAFPPVLLGAALPSQLNRHLAGEDIHYSIKLHGRTSLQYNKQH